MKEEKYITYVHSWMKEHDPNKSYTLNFYIRLN